MNPYPGSATFTCLQLHLYSRPGYPRLSIYPFLVNPACFGNTYDATKSPGPEREVHIRVGGLGDQLYLDLGDDAWRAVEISADG